MNEDIESVFKHCVIVGREGSGKSFFLQLEALRYHRLGVRVVIVDPGSEYRTLCDFVGGTYQEITESDTIVIPEKGFTVISLENISTDKRSVVLTSIVDAIRAASKTKTDGLVPVPLLPELYVVFDLALVEQEHTSVVYEGLLSCMSTDDCRTVIHLCEHKISDMLAIPGARQLLDSVQTILLFPIHESDQEETVRFMNSFCGGPLEGGIPEEYFQARLYFKKRILVGQQNNELLTIDAGFAKKEIVGFY